jgi:2-dehydro-3-deoxygluconokinase
LRPDQEETVIGKLDERLAHRLPRDGEAAGDLGFDADADAVAARYRDAGAREVVVKAGPDPALIVSDRGRWEVGPAGPVTPVDTTGAGDSFNAAYLAARLRGVPELGSARAAHDLAGRVIGHAGALSTG